MTLAGMIFFIAGAVAFLIAEAIFESVMSSPNAASLAAALLVGGYAAIKVIEP